MSKQVEEFLSIALQGYLSDDYMLKTKSSTTLRKYFRESTITAAIAGGSSNSERTESLPSACSEEGGAAPRPAATPSWVSNAALLQFATEHQDDSVRKFLGEEMKFAVSSGGGGHALTAGFGLPLSFNNNNSATDSSAASFSFQTSLLLLLNDSSLCVASTACSVLVQLLGAAAAAATATASPGENYCWLAFVAYWGSSLKKALLLDTNSPSPYQCFMRLGDALAEEEGTTPGVACHQGSQMSSSIRGHAVFALGVLAKEALDTFFHAATISVTNDVLQFVNFVTLIQTLICANTDGGYYGGGGANVNEDAAARSATDVQIPLGLADSILLQLRRPTHDDPFAALAKPQLLHFVGFCAQANGGCLLKDGDADEATITSSSSSFVQMWSVEVLTQISNLGKEGNPAQSTEEVAALRALTVPYLEALGAIGSSEAGMNLIRKTTARSVSAEDVFHGALWGALKSHKSDLTEAALFALSLLLHREVTAEQESSSSSAFVAEFLVSKTLFREVLWSMNKHFEPTVRAKFWRMLNSLISWKTAGATNPTLSNGVGTVAFTHAGTWLVGPENRESEVEVRVEQLAFMKKVELLATHRRAEKRQKKKESEAQAVVGSSTTEENEEDPQQAAMSVLEGKIRGEHDKGLYPRRSGPQTDAGVAE